LKADTVNEETIKEVVARMLFKSNYTLVVAESCTGGLLADKLTDIPGSSNYFLLGITCYSNEAKMELLKVPQETIDTAGAVSEETARAMADNIRSLAFADLALSTTGYAGPGDSPLEPIGLVYVGMATPEGTFCRRFNFQGDRRSIKKQAGNSALNMIRLYLEGSLE